MDRRKRVKKDTKGYLQLSHPDKPWNVLLAEMLTQHGTAAGLARELNLEAQTVRGWVKMEEREGRIKRVAQPRYRYEAVTE